MTEEYTQAFWKNQASQMAYSYHQQPMILPAKVDLVAPALVANEKIIELSDIKATF